MSSRLLLVHGAEAFALMLCFIVGADLAAHRRVERFGGVNIWGYRGPVARQKQPHEIRIALVGGTRAFGWGVAPSEAVTGAVEWQVKLAIDRPGELLRPIVALNLGRLGALADSYASTIEHYGYLDPDYICLFDDLGAPGASGSDRASAVLALTGYAPALPLVLREKGAIWRARGGPFFSAAGRILAFTGSIAGAIDRRAAALVDRAPAAPSRSYANEMDAAIDAAHRHARGVVVVLAPVETAAQLRTWQALMPRLAERRRSDDWLRIVDLSEVGELYDEAVRLDGWNFGAGGAGIEGEAIAPAVLDLIAHQS